MKIRFYTIALLTIITLVACTSDNEISPVQNIEDARARQLINFYDNQMLNLQQLHIVNTANLTGVTQNFTDNSTQENLNTLKEVWKQSFLSWKKIESFTLGNVPLSFFHNRIQRWPVDTVLIENELTGEANLDLAYITSLGASVKGYSTFEYFLYDQPEAETLEGFTTGELATRRKNYILALAQNIEQEALSLRQAWIATEDDFKNNLQTSVDGSQNKLVNSLIAGLEFVKNTKVEESLNATSQNIELLEAYRSKSSKEAIQENIASYKMVYTGDYNGIDGFGLEEYLSETLQNPALNTTIINSFNAVEQSLNAITATLEDTLQTQPALIENLREALSNLVTLLKADFSSAANIIITFSDNDGD